jgi:hypothetical protein
MIILQQSGKEQWVVENTRQTKIRQFSSLSGTGNLERCIAGPVNAARFP